MNSRQSVALLVAFAFLFGSCGDNDKSADTDGSAVTAEVQEPPRDAVADVLAQADSDADADAIEDLVEPPDIVDDDEYTPVGCLGEVECKYNGKAERRCILGPDGMWGWDKVMECPGAQLCVAGVGCTCDLGGCDEDPGECGETVLEPCQIWTCVKNCCEIDLIPPPDCCTSGADCRDCVSLDTGQGSYCPDEIPEGAVADSCTADICEEGHCLHLEGHDDGDDCTVDSCDPETGLYSHIFVPGCGSAPCWGATEEAADGLCFDNDLCTLDYCDFGDTFEPWEGEEDPGFDPFCFEAHPEWPDCNPKPSNVYYCVNLDKVEAGLCDDFDKCTVDFCDADLGCQHECDWDSQECYVGCLDAECFDDDPCTDEYVSADFLFCVYPKTDCADGDPCTLDLCDPMTGCYNEEDPDADETWCDGTACLTNDPDECDDGDECTDDFCDLPPGEEFGICEHTDVVCDDGDPETEEVCVDGVCVAV